MKPRLVVTAAAITAGLALAAAPTAMGVAKLMWIARGASSPRGNTEWYTVAEGATPASGYSQYSAATDVSAARGTALNSVAGRVVWTNTTFPAAKQLALGSVTPSVGFPVFFQPAASPADAADAWGLSYASTTGRLYWGNDPSGADTGTINWSTYETGGGGVLYAASESFVNDPRSAVADPASGRVYWVNTGNNTIGYANLDGSGSGGTIAAPVSGCRNTGTITLASVLVDTAGGYLYLGGNALCRTSLTGGSPVLLADLGSDTALGMALDVVTNRLYWANSTGTMANDTMKYVDASTAGGTPTALPAAGSTSTNGAAYPSVSQNSVPTATLAGGTTVGDTLTCTVTTLPDIPGLAFYREGQTPTYSWQRTANGSTAAVAGASSSQYTPTQFGRYKCSILSRSITSTYVSAQSAQITQATVPTAPLTPSGTAGNGQATVTWAAPTSDGESTITGYTVTASPGGQQCFAAITPRTCTVTGLDNGTSYTFTVAAANAKGNSPSSAATSSVMPVGAPPSPLTPSATAGDGQADVSWSAPASDGGSPITSYDVTASPGGAQCSASPPATSCTVTGLTNGTQYTFTVTATSLLGTSAASGATTGVTPVGISGAANPSVDLGTPGEAGGAALADAASRDTMRLRAPRSATKGGLQVSKSGTLGVPLSCPKSAPVSCDASGVLTMTLPGKVKAELGKGQMAKTRVRELSRFAGVEIGAGSSKLITVRLENKIYTALRKAGIRRVPADLDLANALEGGEPVTSQQRIWLKLVPLKVRVPVTG